MPPPFNQQAAIERVEARSSAAHIGGAAFSALGKAFNAKKPQLVQPLLFGQQGGRLRLFSGFFVREIGDVNELLPVLDAIVLPAGQVLVTGQRVADAEDFGEPLHSIFCDSEFQSAFAANKQCRQRVPTLRLS